MLGQPRLINVQPRARLRAIIDPMMARRRAWTFVLPIADKQFLSLKSR